MQDGYIKIHRQISESSIYLDSQAVHLFLHLLLRANFKARKVMFNSSIVDLKKGQFICGRKTLSEETGINESKIYRLLAIFEKEKLIEQLPNSRYSIITILNWSKYQECEQQMNSGRTAGEQQMNTDNKDKKVKKDKNIFRVPSIDEIKEYCQQRQNNINANSFFDYYQSKGWMIGKNKMKDWKAAIRTWEAKEKTTTNNTNGDNYYANYNRV